MSLPKLIIKHYKKFYLFPFWIILFLFSRVYKFVIKYQRKRGYKFRFPGTFIISIGNITTGGTGKTETAMYLSSLFAKKKNTAIILRGYKGQYKEPFNIINKKSSFEKAGDEAVLLHKKTNSLVIVSRERSIGISEAVKKKKKIIILDDAFQHWKVQRDLNLVLIDSTNPFGNNHLIPAGILREPINALIDADIILLTKCQAANQQSIENLKEQLAGFTLFPVFISIYKVDGVYRKNKKIPVNKIKKKKLVIVSGIGNPEYFISQVHEYLQPSEVRIMTCKDHYQFKRKDRDQLKDFLNRGFDYIITTEKDHIRMDKLDIEPLVFRIKLEITEKNKFDKLIQKWGNI